MFKVGDKVEVVDPDEPRLPKGFITEVTEVSEGMCGTMVTVQDMYVVGRYYSSRFKLSSPLLQGNPKDAIGATKLPLSLVPDSLTAYAALSFAEGAGKYGAYNWRGAGVRASIYIEAAGRHIAKWWNGEECDPVTTVPHLASAIASLGIVLDSRLVDKLTDDRPPKADMGALIEGFEGILKHLKELHKDKHPKHFTELNKDE